MQFHGSRGLFRSPVFYFKNKFVYCLFIVLLYIMKEKKQSFTYSGLASTRRKAIAKAKKSNFTFSELVESLLICYANDTLGSITQTDYEEYKKSIGL